MKIFGMGMPELIIIWQSSCSSSAPRTFPNWGLSLLGKTVKGMREGLGGDKKEAVEEEEEDVEEPASVKAIEGEVEGDEAPAPKKRVKKVVKTTA